MENERISKNLSLKQKKKIKGTSYSASSIQVLEGVDNSIDEAMAGYCTHIEVTINEDNSITVQDNGRGIPVDMHEKEKHKSALEVGDDRAARRGQSSTRTPTRCRADSTAGVSCVNALSTHMLSQVFRNGKIYQQEYACGKPLYPVKVVGETDCGAHASNSGRTATSSSPLNTNTKSWPTACASWPT